MRLDSKLHGIEQLLNKCHLFSDSSATINEILPAIAHVSQKSRELCLKDLPQFTP